MININALEQAVAAQPTIVTSVETFIQELKTQLMAEFANDADAQAKIDAALTTVLSNNQRLAAAIQTTPPPTP